MKLRLHSVMFFLLLAIIGYSFASLDNTFTHPIVDSKKELCRQTVDKYYYDCGFLLGNKKIDIPATDQDKAKDEKINYIQKKYYRDSIRIESDIPQLHKNRYFGDDYLNDIAEVFNKVNGNYKSNITNISDIFQNDSKGYYFMIVTVEKELVPDADNDNNNSLQNQKKTVDMFFNFFPGENNLKIYDIRNHEDNVLDGLIPVRVLSDEEVENRLSKKKSYIIFNVTPSDAKVLIDGDQVDYANGQKLEIKHGTHKIEFKSGRYNSEIMDVEIAKKETYTISKNLSLKTGYLNVLGDNNNDYGATILVNNTEIGTVPLKNYPLAVGDYKIKIKNGMRHKTCRITIDENRETNVSVQLNSNNYLYGVVNNNFVYQDIPPVYVPNFYFSDPYYHTYIGQPHPTTNYMRSVRSGYYPQQRPSFQQQTQPERFHQPSQTPTNRPWVSPGTGSNHRGSRSERHRNGNSGGRVRGGNSHRGSRSERHRNGNSGGRVRGGNSHRGSSRSSGGHR